MMIASPFWGVLSDRFGRKLMVERAMFGGAVMLTLMAFARSAEELVILRAIQGLITGTVGAANALVAASAPRKHMGYAMGVLQVAMGVGIAIGPVIGGFMADLFGYQAAFYVTGSTLFLSGVLVHFGVKENFEKPVHNPSKKHYFISEWSGILRTKGVAITFFLRFLNQMGRMIFIPVLPLFVAMILNETGRINSFTGVVVGATSVAMTLSSIYLGKLGDRIGHKQIAVGSALACSLFLGLQVFIDSGWQLILLHGLLGLGFGGIIPSGSAILSNLTAAGEAGAVYGMDSSIVSGARTIAPMLGVSIAMWFGLRAVFGTGALLFGLAAVLAMFMLPDTLQKRVKEMA
jgi:DHA1 family multidrug resistance protein-like MFS transporter